MRKGVKEKKAKPEKMKISKKYRHAKGKNEVIVPASPRLFTWSNK
jgi:hypothetical protein